MWLAFALFAVVVFEATRRAVGRRQGGGGAGPTELDGYSIERMAGTGDLRLTFTTEARRRIVLDVDPRVAYRLADDMTRAAMRAAPQKGGGP
jgi:hypothetical protein